MAQPIHSDNDSDESTAETAVFVHRSPSGDDAISDFIFCSFADDVAELLEAPGPLSGQEWVESRVMAEYESGEDELDELVPAEEDREGDPIKVGRVRYNVETGEIVDLTLELDPFGERELVTDGGRDVVDELEIKATSEEAVEERRDVVRAVLTYLQATGGAAKSELEAEVLEDQRGGYKTTLAAWKHLVRPALSDLTDRLDELERPSGSEHRWRWIEADTDTLVGGIPREAGELEAAIEEDLRRTISGLEEGDVVEVTYRSAHNGNDLEVTGEVVAIEGEESPPLYRDVVLQDANNDRELVLMRESLELATRGWQGDRRIGDVLGIASVDVDESQQADVEKSDAPKAEALDLAAEMSEDEPSEAVARAARELVAGEIRGLVERGLTPAQALDYWFTVESAETYGQLSQTAWAESRGTSPQAVSERVRVAREALEDAEE